MSYLKQFARMLGVQTHQAEDALTNERAAKLALSRRSFIGVGAALATGAAFSFYKMRSYLPWNDEGYLYVALENKHGETYERVAVRRSPDAWRVTGGDVEAVEVISFPACTYTLGMIVTHAVIYDAGGHRMFKPLPLNTPIRVMPGVTPRLTSLKANYDELLPLT